MFEVGDEVVLLVDRPGGNGMLRRGDTGVVCCVEHGFIGVEFRKRVSHHDCAGTCASGYGWYVANYAVAIVREKEDFCSCNEDEIDDLLCPGRHKDERPKENP